MQCDEVSDLYLRYTVNCHIIKCSTISPLDKIGFCCIQNCKSSSTSWNFKFKNTYSKANFISYRFQVLVSHYIFRQFLRLFNTLISEDPSHVLSVNYYAAVNYFKVTFISYRFPVLVSHYISLVSEPVLHINFRGSFVWTCQLYLSSICFENRTMTFFTGPDGSTPQSHLSIFQWLPR